MAEWISVEDRLPKTGIAVLTYDDYFKVSISHLCMNGPDVKNKHCILWAGNSDVTHWMPLPEPPK